MAQFRLLGLLAIGVVNALAIGGFAMFVQRVPGSDAAVASVAVFVLTAAAVAGGVVVGSRDRPDKTAYW